MITNVASCWNLRFGSARTVASVIADRARSICERETKPRAQLKRSRSNLRPLRGALRFVAESRVEVEEFD